VKMTVAIEQVLGVKTHELTAKDLHRFGSAMRACGWEKAHTAQGKAWRKSESQKTGENTEDTENTTG